LDVEKPIPKKRQQKEVRSRIQKIVQNSETRNKTPKGVGEAEVRRQSQAATYGETDDVMTVKTKKSVFSEKKQSGPEVLMPAISKTPKYTKI